MAVTLRPRRCCREAAAVATTAAGCERSASGSERLAWGEAPARCLAPEPER